MPGDSPICGPADPRDRAALSYQAAWDALGHLQKSIVCLLHFRPDHARADDDLGYPYPGWRDSTPVEVEKLRWMATSMVTAVIPATRRSTLISSSTATDSI